jgi:hypothetical protein
MQVPIDNVGSIGLIADIFSAETPPEAWTTVQNVRMGPQGAEKFLGHTKTVNTASAGWTQQPIALFYAPVAGSTGFIVGPGLTKVYVRSAIAPYTETEITRLAGVYAATQDKKWTGSVFGGIFILNNGVDEPQVWNPVIVGTKLANLSAFGSSPWVTTHRCGCMRPFGRYLVATDVTKAGTRFPQMVKWSHSADPGSLPSSWSITDPAVDAGEFGLQDATGVIVDHRGLRNKQMLYTTDQVWQMSYVGGTDIMGFDPVLREQGALGINCVTLFKKSGAELHAVFGGNDIYVHNGQSADSIISPLLRRWLYQQIDASFYARSFVVANPQFTEIWFCFPEQGYDQPSIAFVWNWTTGATSFRDLLKVSSGGDTRVVGSTAGTPFIGQAFIDDTSTEPWTGDTQTWNADTTIWNTRSSNPAVVRLLMADRSAGNRTFLVDDGQTYDGSSISWKLERTYLSIIGRDREGNPKNDTTVDKLITELWPRFDAPIGTQITCNIGTSFAMAGAVSWGVDQTYNVGVDEFVPVYYSGRYISVRFSGTHNVGVRGLGYALDIVQNGVYS